VASVKAAADFDQAMTRVAALSNTSASAVEGMRDEVLKLSGETAQAPQELADALFFLASAGLDAEEVMPALEASAKGAAVGLGTTADVANIVASAMNAYSKSGLTAAQVTDTLTAAVREGRAEPEEFAQALGRILPIASTIGVTFDQVTASLASLSNIGLDVNEGVTAMRGVFQALAAPT
jgi:TP901 family phage tail tape measure protein